MSYSEVLLGLHLIFRTFLCPQLTRFGIEQARDGKQIETNKQIFCMHGGLSPELHHFDQIRLIQRPTYVPQEGLLCDLLWSDPDGTKVGWGENDRGISYTFGTDIVSDWTEKLGLDLIVRAHQVVQDGYEFFANRRLVTIFTAPNYCGEFDNAGGILSVDENLICKISILRAAPGRDSVPYRPKGPVLSQTRSLKSRSPIR